MPFRSIPALRRDLPPVIVFRGSLGEAERLAPEEISRVLTPHVGRFDPSLLKERVLCHMRDLSEPGGPSARVAIVPLGRRSVALKLMRLAQGGFLVRQYPATHGVRPCVSGADLFRALVSITRHGFEGKASPNAVVNLGAGARGVKSGLRSGLPAVSAGKDFTGDSYSIDFLSSFVLPRSALRSSGSPHVFVDESDSGEVLRVNITIAGGLSSVERRERMAAYRAALAGVPLSFR